MCGIQTSVGILTAVLKVPFKKISKWHLKLWHEPFLAHIFKIMLHRERHKVHHRSKWASNCILSGSSSIQTKASNFCFFKIRVHIIPRALPCLRQSVAGLSLCRPGFDFEPLHIVLAQALRQFLLLCFCFPLPLSLHQCVMHILITLSAMYIMCGIINTLILPLPLCVPWHDFPSDPPDHNSATLPCSRNLPFHIA